MVPIRYQSTFCALPNQGLSVSQVPVNISDSILASWLISSLPLNSYHFPTGTSSFLLITLLFWLCSLLVFFWSSLCLHLPPPPCPSFSPGQAWSAAMFRPILSFSSLDSSRCPWMYSSSCLQWKPSLNLTMQSHAVSLHSGQHLETGEAKERSSPGVSLRNTVRPTLGV